MAFGSFQVRAEIFRYGAGRQLGSIQTLKAKRLVDNFGLFRGVQVPDDLTDDDIDEYILLLYRFVRGSGYNFAAQGSKTDIFESLKRRIGIECQKPHLVTRGQVGEKF